ncbi:AraC family transcriptional regulator [Skermanella stibiiresistens SB22]|uniref:AraC family transcriptional regulator n=1 Tax=Skermanella stibiiresistens SB22 TaxID=1385369 RepID=W9H9R1_9PROT|nr:GlxA family transcriptional regulator [Skermanella stibiiresistens]EWY42664.1 AraC family transcriptional regulator [Skermanella stibiiresistens SB22]
MSTPETVGFLLIPQFSLIAFTAALEPLRLANHISGRELYRWVLLSPDGASGQASCGLRIAVDHGIDAAPELPTIIVCSGIDGHWYDDRTVLSWLRRRATRGVEFGSLCTASHILARAGLLNGYRCTIHWENLAGFSETYPEIDATGELFNIDRNRFTCAGGTAAMDMMLHRVASAHGDKLAVGIAEQLLHEKIRQGSVRQREAIQPDPGIEREELAAAVKLMMANIEEPLDLLTLSNQLGQSRRNVERLFRKFMNCSPARYYLGLRLKRARQLLFQTRMSVMEVAISCGFVSATHFSKCYRDYFGVAPRDDQSGHRLRPLTDPARQHATVR